VSDELLLFEKRDGGVAWLTLNRPSVLNAVNMAMRDAIWETLHAIADDPDVRAVVFAGAGERAFSAGADITEFGTAPSYIEARGARRDRDLWGYMLSMSKPLVAAVHGIAYGAGCELALCCDLRIAADDATFALPEVKLGYMPSAGGTQTLPRTVPAGIAREMVLAGEPIGTQRALAIGLVNRVVPPAQLAAEADAIAGKLAALSPEAVAAAKASLARGQEIGFETALRIDAAAAAALPRNAR
jgi:enoyl-CoA hydratase/carnithine racemase